MAETRQKDVWDKLLAIAGVAASILVPLVIAFVGNEHSNAIKESENRVKYTELAISILNGPPSNTNQGVRGWDVAPNAGTDQDASRCGFEITAYC